MYCFKNFGIHDLLKHHTNYSLGVATAISILVEMKLPAKFTVD